MVRFSHDDTTVISRSRSVIVGCDLSKDCASPETVGYSDRRLGFNSWRFEMAKETITRLVDDLDGGTAHETVTFGLDGVAYEIDLSSKNARKLRSELAGYIDKGTRMSGRRMAARAAGGRGGGGSRGN